QEVRTYLAPADDPLAVAPDRIRWVSGPDGVIDARVSEWSPDGKRLGFTSMARGFAHMGTFDPASGAVDWITGGEHDTYGPSWARDGERLAYVVNHDGNYTIFVRRLSDGQETEIAAGPGVHSAPAFLPDGRIVFAFTSPAHPNDLWLADRASGKLRRLTDSLPLDNPGDSFAAGQAVRYPSADGQEVPALLYRPRGAVGPTPAVVFIHGGPTAQHVNTWDPLTQYLLSRGITVLAPNYRGSTGYGRAFMEANRLDLGGGDLADVVAGADYLLRQGLADPSRVALTGGSYGGYLTMLALTKTPDGPGGHGWAAGSAVVPFVNWFTEYENEREDLKHWDRENLGDPVADAGRYRDRSPIFFIDNARAPVQIIAGAHDPRCPASEAQQARDALLARGIEVDFVVYPDEGHGFRSTENRVDALLRRAAFLERHLTR
ncbi:MAG: S9 family peptidase, partial [Chloroflexi bacterium]|nr:S9 family peptidase [Chloroflexota bacterium]